MNASYKIVLLGAFVLFAAVVGYYFLSAEGQDVDQHTLNDEYPKAEPGEEQGEPEPNPRDTLGATSPPVREAQPQPQPQPEDEPVSGQETVGLTTEELPAAPVIERNIGIERGSSEDTRDGRDTDTGLADRTERATEETAESDAEPRPGPGTGPGTESGDPAEGTTETEAGPESEDQPESEPWRRPVPPDPATIPRTYTVKEGDLLSTIAAEFYGDQAKWYQIAQANPTIDPKRLQIGQVIVLPNLQTDVREREEVRPPAPGQDQNYTVRPGDNLSKIAKRFYGDTGQWELIYARNRQLIGPRPDALKVGMELVIPQAYDGAE